jgi:hypothetical protein
MFTRHATSFSPQSPYDNVPIAAAQKLLDARKDAADASTKRPADEAASSLNANDVLMLHRRLKMIQNALRK